MNRPLVVGFTVGLAVLYFVNGWAMVGLSLVTGALLIRFAVRGPKHPARRPAGRQRRRRVWSDEERRFILDRDGWRCVYCGSTDELEIDHIVPFSRGGACSLNNVAVLCGPCNRAKGAS